VPEDSLTPLTAVVGTEYSGTAVAHDANVGDTLTFSLVAPIPTGMIIDGSTGAISGWTPSCDDIGDVDVIVKVTDDGCGALTDQDTFTIVVSSDNIAPVVDSLTPLTAVVGTEYSGTAVAHDANVGDTLTFSLVAPIPTGMIIDGSTGAISGWTPSCDDAPSVDVTVKVTDDGCEALTDQDTFTITVPECCTSAELLSFSIRIKNGPTYNIDLVDAATSGGVDIIVETGEPQLWFTVDTECNIPDNGIKYTFFRGGSCTSGDLVLNKTIYSGVEEPVGNPGLQICNNGTSADVNNILTIVVTNGSNIETYTVNIYR